MRTWSWLTCGALLLGLSGMAAGCARHPPAPPRPDTPLDERVGQALRRASRFLLDRQGPDGAWRSDLYGQFRDGTGLTPLVLQALLGTPPDPERDAALGKGAAYLAGLARGEAALLNDPLGLAYPVYTSAGAVEVLSRWGPDRHRTARDAWLAYLRGRQLTERLGWDTSDRQYGGWGYCPVVPRKPGPHEPAPPLLESNLSATVFALSALRAAGVPADDPAYRRALVFVERCQNFAAAGRADPKFDDGGFFFIHGDAVRNKAGAAGRDAAGRERFHSYGSATADGLRALLLCGLPADHVRVAGARVWLTAHFRTDRHPGEYHAEREPGRQAVYYYFCRSAGQAFDALGVGRLGPGGELRWREAVAQELLERQREDGSWANPTLLVREDEPLVATSFAVLTLAPPPER